VSVANEDRSEARDPERAEGFLVSVTVLAAVSASERAEGFQFAVAMIVTAVVSARSRYPRTKIAKYAHP